MKLCLKSYQQKQKGWESVKKHFKPTIQVCPQRRPQVSPERQGLKRKTRVRVPQAFLGF